MIILTLCSSHLLDNVIVRVVVLRKQSIDVRRLVGAAAGHIEIHALGGNKIKSRDDNLKKK